jgi:hypothetical protein
MSAGGGTLRRDFLTLAARRHPPELAGEEHAALRGMCRGRPGAIPPKPNFPPPWTGQGVCLRKCMVIWCCLTTGTRDGGRRRAARGHAAGGGWAW